MPKDTHRREMPVERFEPSTLAGLVFETSAYTVPPHRLITDRPYNNASMARSQELDLRNLRNFSSSEFSDSSELLITLFQQLFDWNGA